MKSYIKLLRPFTLVAPFVAGLLGYYALSRTLDYKALILSFIFSLLQGCGQVVNQIADVDIDKINKPYRPIVKGEVSTKEAWALALALLVVSLSLSLTVSHELFLATLALAFFSIFYNIEPIRAKRHYLLSYSWLAVSRGFWPWYMISLVAGNLDKALMLGAVSALWVWTTQCTKDVPDVEGDRLANIKTLPVVYGVEGVRWWIIINSWLMAFLFGQFRLPLIFDVIPFLGLACAFLMDVKLPFIENNASWALFYLTLMLIYLLPCFV